MNVKAFVSSTYQDLSAHRQHVIQTLRDAGITVDPMEDWTADSGSPKRLAQNRVKGCDLCILLVAFRRGFVPEGEVESITQLEYKYAINHGIDVLVFLLKDNEPWPPKYCDLAGDPGITAWRDELRRNHVVSEFRLEPDSVHILPAVMRWLSARKDLHRTILPMAEDLELVTESYYETSFPAYVLDAERCVISWNTSFMELVGEHDGPARSQPLKDWLASKGHEMTVVSAGKQSGPSVERATITLNTEKFGRMKFDLLTTPVIDRELGTVKYYTAALSPSETERDIVERFLEAVEKRLKDQLFWSRYAVAYDRVLTRYSGYNELVGMHCNSVQKAPPGRVLDIGAGTGNITLKILQLCPERAVIAVDYNQAMLYHQLRKCRTFENRIEIRFAEVEQLIDITPGSVAAVVMNNVLMFLKEPSKLLERVYWWLKDGGVISLHVADESVVIDTLLLDIQRELENSGDFKEVSRDFKIVSDQNREMFSGNRPFNKFSSEGLTRLLNEAGFTVEHLKYGTYAGQGLYALAKKGECRRS